MRPDGKTEIGSFCRFLYFFIFYKDQLREKQRKSLKGKLQSKKEKKKRVKLGVKVESERGCNFQST